MYHVDPGFSSNRTTSFFWGSDIITKWMQILHLAYPPWLSSSHQKRELRVTYILFQGEGKAPWVPPRFLPRYNLCTFAELCDTGFPNSCYVIQIRRTDSYSRLPAIIGVQYSADAPSNGSFTRLLLLTCSFHYLVIMTFLLSTSHWS